ncbi:unnamed protein product, partial [Phaeothamnion confervicola]
MKKLRLFLVSILAVTAAPVWAAPPVTIRFFHAMRGQRGVQLERITKKYEELHPGVHVEIKAVLDANQRTGNDYSALYRGVLESLAQKNPPEVSQLYENWVSQLLEVSALQPLDKDLNGLIQDLSPAFKALSRSADGKYYSVPFNKSVWVLYYNKDMFAKAGVQPPKTWEELRQVSTAIAKATGKPGLVFRPGVDVFSLRFLADGGTYLDPQGKPTFNTAGAASALGYWVDMVHQDRSCLPTLKSLEVFAQGNAGMLLDTTSKLGRLESEASLNLGAAPLPAGTRSAPLLAGTNLGVFRVKDPVRQKAALDFAAYLTSPEVQVGWCEDSGYLPVRKAALTSADYQKFLSQHPNHGVGVQALPHLVSQPEVAGWESVRGLLDDAFY